MFKSPSAYSYQRSPMTNKSFGAGISGEKHEDRPVRRKLMEGNEKPLLLSGDKDRNSIKDQPSYKKEVQRVKKNVEAAGETHSKKKKHSSKHSQNLSRFSAAAHEPHHDAPLIYNRHHH